MTCNECQGIMIDIARGVEVDRAAREDARRHAALCARCGEQQQEQLWLTTQLRAVAAESAVEQAPPRVEIAVLAAWRASQNATAAAPAAAIADTPAIETVAAKPRSAWMMPSLALGGLAAAAMALLIVWPSANKVANTPASSGSALHSVNNPATAGTRAALDSNKQGRGDGATAMDTAAAASEDAEPAVEELVAMQDTEFLPLPYTEPLRAEEARHVVRVSMTSGDEMILGMLPADRRSGQPFEADVLVGEDGIARAIRIVQ